MKKLFILALLLSCAPYTRECRQEQEPQVSCSKDSDCPPQEYCKVVEALMFCEDAPRCGVCVD